MLCTNRATVEPVPSQARWWVLIPDPAPFCASCKAAAEKKTA